MSVLPTVVGVALEGVISGKVWRMDVRRWVAAALCVPLLALAGCSDDEPQAEPQDPSTQCEAVADCHGNGQRPRDPARGDGD